VVATRVVAVIDGYRVFFLVEVVLCLVGAAVVARPAGDRRA
jgi:hypothetical protein